MPFGHPLLAVLHVKSNLPAYLPPAPAPMSMNTGAAKSGGERTRRQIFYLASGALVAACALPRRTRAQSPRAAADFVFRNCRAFLRARAGTRAVMWRGGDGVGSVNPPPDLLDAAVYSPEGVRYFRALGDCQELAGLRIATAHIGTGSRNSAAVWGDPVSVWPMDDETKVKQFDFVFWEDQQLIWDENRDSAWATGSHVLQQNGPLVRGKRLAEALQKQKEVLFHVNERGLYAISEEDTPEVVAELQRLDRRPYGTTR